MKTNEIRVDDAEHAIDALIADSESRDHWPAVKFTLETLGKGRGWGKSIEITGDKDKPLRLIQSDMTAAEAAAIWQEMIE